ncbi:hypothetical protein DFH09DRAFT_1270438 [Mycena vulgaris]|nr:hypothetical protein DFH09DRAFT_1270438 [Mycena vulgaris]
MNIQAAVDSRESGSLQMSMELFGSYGPMVMADQWPKFWQKDCQVHANNRCRPNWVIRSPTWDFLRDENWDWGNDGATPGRLNINTGVGNSGQKKKNGMPTTRVERVISACLPRGQREFGDASHDQQGVSPSRMEPGHENRITHVRERRKPDESGCGSTEDYGVARFILGRIQVSPTVSVGENVSQDVLLPTGIGLRLQLPGQLSMPTRKRKPDLTRQQLLDPQEGSLIILANDSINIGTRALPVCPLPARAHHHKVLDPMKFNRINLLSLIQSYPGNRNSRLFGSPRRASRRYPDLSNKDKRGVEEGKFPSRTSL